MGPECYSPYYLDYDWARWAEPAYNVPTLDINWFVVATNNTNKYSHHYNAAIRYGLQ